MQEFETFAYLDLQKAASTSISRLLHEACTERQLFFGKHSRVGGRYDPKKFYFISVRNPVSQYLSLYSYGCSGEGGLYHRLRRAGFDHLYNSSWRGFRQWLNFMLRPSSGVFLDRTYGREAAFPELLGYQSYRYLRLAIHGNYHVIAKCKTREDIRQLHKEHGIVKFTVRTERLQEDLRELLNDHLRHAVRDVDAALKFVSEGPRLRTSDRVDKIGAGQSLPEAQLEKLQDREWLLHELFGY